MRRYAGSLALAGALALAGSGCTASTGSASASAVTSATSTATAPPVVTTAVAAPTPTTLVPSLTPSGATSTSRTTGTPSAAATTGGTVDGVDVSAYQLRVDWAGLAASGVRFAYVKATEGTSFVSPTYAAQRDGARSAGMLVGGYHYARPASSTGAAQARHLLAVTGGWRSDGRSLPDALDLEDSTSGPACHGRTPAQLLSWVREFVDTYHAATGRAPLLYVKAEVWSRCLGGDRSLGAAVPLWLFDHEPPMGPLPAGWERATIWQRGVEGGLDRNVFLGSQTALAAFARSAD